VNGDRRSRFYSRDTVTKITRKFLLDVTSRHANPTRNINRNITDIGSITIDIFCANQAISMRKSDCVCFFFPREYKLSMNPMRILILQAESRSFSAGPRLDYQLYLVRLTVARVWSCWEMNFVPTDTRLSQPLEGIWQKCGDSLGSDLPVETLVFRLTTIHR